MKSLSHVQHAINKKIGVWRHEGVAAAGKGWVGVGGALWRGLDSMEQRKGEK